MEKYGMDWKQIAGLVSSLAGADGSTGEDAAKQCAEEVDRFYARLQEPLVSHADNTDCAAHHEHPHIMAG